MSGALIPRLRMIAGPNGSGKSTIKRYVSRYIREGLFGHYINPDELERTIRQSGFLDFNQFNLDIGEAGILGYFQRSDWLVEAGCAGLVAGLRFTENRLDFTGVEVNSYLVSVASDFIRHQLLVTRQTFTFETVMSSHDKVSFLAKAQDSGFRTYLYYVATEDPKINLSRVAIRVKEGGHNVPEDKVNSRYYRSLKHLWEAIKYSNRAYIFDNSGIESKVVAEVTNARNLELKTNEVPAWFKKYVLDKVGELERHS